MIVAKIDVTKIDKTKLFKGAKGTYLDIVLIETPDNQYGDDYMVAQGVSKEERERGVKGAILGNGKHFGPRNTPSAPVPAASSKAMPDAEVDDDVPF